MIDEINKIKLTCFLALYVFSALNIIIFLKQNPLKPVITDVSRSIQLQWGPAPFSPKLATTLFLHTHLGYKWKMS